MALTREQAKTRIRDAGLRATTPRVAVLRLLANAGRALSHSDVVTQLGNRDFDQATVYRNLVKLTEAGLARIGSHAAGQRRYEYVGAGPRHLHPHFVCDDFGGVTCLTEVTVTQHIEPAWQTALEAAQLHFVGQCPTCRA